MTAYTNNGVLRNTAVGFETMMTGADHAATDNVALGFRALKALTTGDQNVAIGSGAGDTLNSNSQNVAVGTNSMGAAGTFNSVAVGFAAGAVMTGGGSNTLVGSASGNAIVGGANNVAMGRNSLLTGTTGHENTIIGYSADVDNIGDSAQVKIGAYGIKKWKTKRITLDGYSSGFGTDLFASSTAMFSVPIYSHISKVWCKIITLSQGTAVYSIAMGTASGDAVGAEITGRVELLGNGVPSGIITRSQATDDASTDILASAGSPVGMVWIANINVETSGSPGWCDAAMYFYVSCAGTGNNQSDPGTDAVLDIGVEYY